MTAPSHENMSHYYKDHCPILCILFVWDQEQQFLLDYIYLLRHLEHDAVKQMDLCIQISQQLLQPPVR
uniref:Uncharacterized protein n=1 Tax=Rhizophora mucronata TaxID=61149 RepID=A0A2P2QT38_RHIMU